MPVDSLTRAWLADRAPKFKVLHTGTSWGVFFIGPRGGRKHLVTYYEKESAITLSTLLNKQWGEGEIC